MCGISGFVGDFLESDLDKMNRVTAHRGPDDFGTYYKNNVGLAHRRLSIIDLAGGHQPMTNEDGTIWIVYNGEVYNFQSLHREHLTKHQLKTKSDTEVILHLYEEYGEKCVDYLRGMFAFAIWDQRKQKLLVVRDRFGIKPLYYAKTSKGLIFASEMKAILETEHVERKVDMEALNLFLTFRYVPGSRTMIDGISKLQPAQYMLYQNGNVNIREYWDLSFDKDSGKPESYYSEGLTEILRESIKMRLISDVPLGAYLSGGLDSSFMIGLMSQVMDDPIKTFTAGFEGEWHDESPYADIVAKEFKTDHCLLKAKPDAVGVLKKVIWHLDEPLADAATIPTYLLSELTRKHVTVVLSGEGSDELLAGYDKYKFLFYRKKISPFLFKPMFSCLANIFSKNIKFQRGFNLLGGNRGEGATYLDLVSVFTKAEKQNVLGSNLAALRGNDCASHDIVSKCLDANKGGDFLDRLMYLDIKTWLPNDVLLKNDKMTMAHSLEARVPFLDHKFAEFTTKIPSNLKLKWLSEKYILRKSMKGLIPEEIIKRKKHGFTVPIKTWMDGDLKSISDDIFSKRKIEERGYWNYPYIERLLQKDMGNEFYRRQFWTILTFEMWHKIFIEREG